MKDLITSKQAENEKLTLKQMLQILIIALTQARAGNTSEKLLNEIRQIINFFVSTKRRYNKYTTMQQYNEFNKVIKRNGYCIYGLILTDYYSIIRKK